MFFFLSVQTFHFRLSRTFLFLLTTFCWFLFVAFNPSNEFKWFLTSANDFPTTLELVMTTYERMATRIYWSGENFKVHLYRRFQSKNCYLITNYFEVTLPLFSAHFIILSLSIRYKCWTHRPQIQIGKKKKKTLHTIYYLHKFWLELAVSSMFIGSI